MSRTSPRFCCAAWARRGAADPRTLVGLGALGGGLVVLAAIFLGRSLWTASNQANQPVAAAAANPVLLAQPAASLPPTPTPSEPSAPAAPQPAPPPTTQTGPMPPAAPAVPVKKGDAKAARPRQDESAQRAAMQRAALAEVERGAFQKVELLATALKNRISTSGEPELRWLQRMGFDLETSRPDLTEEGYQKLVDQFEKWAADKPDSYLARLAAAGAWTAFAWHARGHALAALVPEEASQRFAERMVKAIPHLKAAEALPAADCEVFAMGMAVARATGQDDVALELFKKGCARDKYYYALYSERAHQLMLRWGGGPGELEAMALEAMQATQDRLGKAVYARIALSISMSYPAENMLEEYPKLSWKLIDEGFADLARQFPKSILLPNGHCLMACKAGDRDRARALFKHPQSTFIAGVWRKEEYYDRWKTWAEGPAAAAHQVAVQMPFQAAIQSAALDPAGANVVIGAGTREVVLYDARLQAGRSIHRCTSSVRALDYSPDGKQIAIGQHDGSVEVLTIATGETIELARHDQHVWTVSFSPDGKRLASAGADGQVILWNLADQKPQKLSVFDVPANTPKWLMAVWSPQGDFVASAGDDSTVSLWNAKNSVRNFSFRQFKHPLCGLAFSPDGKWLAAGGLERNVGLYSLETKGLTTTLAPFDNPIHALCFSPDGKWLASADGLINRVGKTTITIWDFERRQPHVRLEGHTMSVRSMEFLPDNEHLLSASADGTIRLWKRPAAAE